MPDFPALTHVALTVTDLERSIPWYSALFGAEPAMDVDRGSFREVAWRHPTFGLHQHVGGTDERATELRAGLDHGAFGCADRAELEAWVARLDELGIERGEILDERYGSGLAFRDPDGIQLELYARRR